MSKMDRISRRSFLVGAAGIGALATMGLSSCAAKAGNGSSSGSASSSSSGSSAGQGASGFPEYAPAGSVSAPELEESAAVGDPITEYASEETYDVVVVGAGVGGVPCAIAAYEAGANVCLLQKESVPVGQGMGGSCVNMDDTNELGAIHLIHSLRDFCELQPNWALNKVWADNCFEALSWYAEKCTEAGMVEGTDFTFGAGPAKFEYPEGNVTMKMFNPQGGMDSPTKKLGEYFAEKFTVKFSTPGVQLIVDNGEVTGIYADQGKGEYIKINATKGVILATGDYQNNTAMVEKYVPNAQPFERKQMNKTGDGQLMGMMAGGLMQPIVHTKMIHAKNWGANATVLRDLPFMAVNMNGVRFCAEDVEMYYRNNLVRNQPDGVWITIMDSNYNLQCDAMGYAGLPVEDLEAVGEEGGVYKADTLEELASKLGVPTDAFVDSVNRYNELCSQGGDLDFGKPTEYMLPVNTPPFYGLHREFAISAITSGLVINNQAQVLDKDEVPIEGLYAIGNCSGPFYGSIDYPAEIPGLSVSRCITYGYVIGSAVAKK